MKWVLFFLDFLIVCVLWFNKIFVFIITIIIIMHKTFIKLHFSDPIAWTDESITVKARAWRWSFLTGGIWGCLHPADSPADSVRTSLSWAADAAVADPGKGQRSHRVQLKFKLTEHSYLHTHICMYANVHSSQHWRCVCLKQQKPLNSLSKHIKHCRSEALRNRLKFWRVCLWWCFPPQGMRRAFTRMDIN